MLWELKAIALFNFKVINLMIIANTFDDKNTCEFFFRRVFEVLCLCIIFNT